MELLLVQHVLLVITVLLLHLLLFLVLMECGQLEVPSIALLVMTDIFVNRLKPVQLLQEKNVLQALYVTQMILLLPFIQKLLVLRDTKPKQL